MRFLIGAFFITHADLKSKKTYTKNEALLKMQKYCAYSERCHHDVRMKLIKIQIYGDDLEEIISELVSENFLNEERYATAYARGKFRHNHWGRNKILAGLKTKNISAYCIRQAMKEISEEDYLAKLRTLMRKRQARRKEDKNKTAQYLISKGYESYLVWQELSASSPE